MKKIKVKCVVDRSINYPQTSKNPFAGIYPNLKSIEYTIYINQITCLSANIESETDITAGTNIRLACGLEITAEDNMQDIEKLIEKAFVN